MKKTNLINVYEAKQFDGIIEWMNEKPRIVSGVISTVTAPFTWAVEKVVRAKLIEGTLAGADNIPEMLTYKDYILRDAKVSEVKELRSKDLALSDKLAKEVRQWADIYAAVENGMIETIIPSGRAFDISAIIIMALRVIHKIGICYGYECNTPDDQKFVLGVMSAAGANTMTEKTAALATITKLNVMVAKTTLKKMIDTAATNKYSAEELMVAIKSTAKELGINLTKRKALQAIPIIGNGMIVSFIYDIANAAQKSYQQRWLYENKKITDE